MDGDYLSVIYYNDNKSEYGVALDRVHRLPRVERDKKTAPPQDKEENPRRNNGGWEAVPTFYYGDAILESRWTGLKRTVMVERHRYPTE